MGTHKYNNKILDVRKDRLDLRDRAYMPILKYLPKSYPDFDNIELIIKCYKFTDMILDQGRDGACTGYALATVINYLFWKKLISENYEEFLENPLGFNIKKVSPKMLFNLARIYDEWDGEDYEGSSCRGAMKGWHKHGVCQEKLWEFSRDEPKDGWQLDAIEQPLGAYYRVNKDSIVDMQSAICEVGAIYVSANIHDGWWELKDIEKRDIKDVNIDVPYIPYHSFPVGSHAFVIVGYTRYGFIIQNSWGVGWGNSGFAILSYKDWLEHGMDAWVAVVGVPIDIDISPDTYSNLSLNVKCNEVIEGTKTIKKALTYKYSNPELRPTSEEVAYKHTLVINNYGRAKHTVIYTSSVDKSTRIISYDNIKKYMESKSGDKRVVIYALGGFKDEKEYISKIRVMIPYFLKNGIYPIFLIWQDSYVEAIINSINDEYGDIEIKTHDERDALNRAIENYARKISTRAIWSEIKEKSNNANKKRIFGFKEGTRVPVSGALYVLTNNLEKLQKEDGFEFDINVIAHSAGSQLIATSWLKELAKRGMRLNSMHLLSPTISIQDCNIYIKYAIEKSVLKMSDIYIYMLDRDIELSDNVGKYGKSILYLISRALDHLHKTPLLGLQDSWIIENTEREDGVFNTQQLNQVKKWFNRAINSDDICNLYFMTKEDNIQLKRSLNNDFVKLSNQNLDSSIFILDRILKYITTGSVDGELKYPIENLC
ncbi:MAG: C1 family peptidase [Epsilonproteobacteria bacterium]|nr:C1 family peptidase [Campylobacterota bacterium]